MLTDEEKEAIEKLSGKKNETTWDDTIRQIKREEIKDVVVTRQKYITAVLKLIEKQSKEIEELKEINRQVKFLYDDACKCLLNTIDKDKIKAKIEEYDDKGMTVNLANRSAGKTFQQAVYYEVKEVLQSLLEKE